MSRLIHSKHGRSTQIFQTVKKFYILAIAVIPAFITLISIPLLLMSSRGSPRTSNKPLSDQEILNSSHICQDDPRLVEAVRRLIVPPTTHPYQFSNDYLANDTTMDTSAGQTQAVKDILKGFSKGFFIECGAHDGETFSDTLWAERHLGWEGLLIEPDPEVYLRLIAKHRKAHHAKFCISPFDYPQILPFYVDKTVNGLGSGLIRSSVYFATESVPVQCVPLYTALLAMNRTVVDYFSLDVEGSELDILRTIPFDKVLFKVIVVEHVLLQEGKLGLREFMEDRGYLFYRTVVDDNFAAGDSIFIHSSIPLKPLQQLHIGIEDSDLMRKLRF